MRSINVKRVAAVAAGAAMIGSVMASGVFGAVSTTGDVTTLVNSIKANLGSTQVVVGTDGADISDGIQAAKISSTLASLNYQVSSVADLTCDIGTPTVTVKTGVVDVAKGTTSKVYAEYAADVTTANSAYTTDMTNKTITKTQFSDILSEKTLAATVNSTAYTFTYEDRIELYDGQPKYSQSASGTTTGHGLYYKVNSGTSGYRGIVYHVKFGGSGIPVGDAFGYQETPEIEIAGDLYGLDWKNTASGTLALQTGTKQTMLEGDSVTSEGYTITLTGIGATTTTSGTQYTAAFEITDGTTTQTGSVTEGSTGYYFQQKVSINVEDILYGTSTGNKAIVRIGTGTATFSAGSSWTAAGATTTDAEWVVEAITTTGTGATLKLTDIKLKYGNPSNLDMDYNFDGTYLRGLAEDVAINGPLTKTGTAYFQLELEGLGSQSTVVDTTDLTFEGIGSESDYSGYIKTSWTSRDAMQNIWNPRTPTEARFAVTPGTGAWSAAAVNLDKANGEAYWTIVNDKVVYLVNTPVQSATGGRTWNAVFKIGKSDGTEVTVTGINASQPGILEYSSTVNPIYCNVTFTAANNISLNVLTGYENNMSSTSDQTTGMCDLYPEIVTFGNAITIDATTGKAPYMNMLWVDGNYTQTNATIGVNPTTTAVNEPWPFVIVNESSAGNYFAVVYDDDDTTGASDTYTGLKVVGGHLITADDGHQQLNLSNGTYGTSYIDQARQTKYENSLYQITTMSTEMDGSTQNVVTATVPEAARNSLVKVESEITTVEGEDTVGVGDTVGNVEILSVNVPDCTVSGTVTGDIYTVRSALTPESLITTDTAASATYQIVIGGHYVNTVARTMSEAARNSISQAGAQYLIAEGNKLMVAGYTATDTAAAANQLITMLKA